MATQNPKSKIQNGPQAQVLYDGQCALCLKSVRLLQRLDWLRRLTFVNARDLDQLPARQPPLEPDRLMQEMHLLTPGGRSLLHGFAAFRWIAWRLPALWPVAPFLYVPGVPNVGQRLYLWIARNRFRLIPCHGGVCTIQHGFSPDASPKRR